MVKVIPITMAITIAISTFGVESTWIPHIVKRIEFVNAPGESSSKQDNKQSSTSNNDDTNTSKAEGSPTSKDSTPTNKPSASFSNASSKSSPTSSVPIQPNPADSTISSTTSLASSVQPSTATSSIESPISSEISRADQNSSKSNSSSGAVGAVVAMAIIIVIGAVAYLIVRRKKAKQNRVKMVEKADPFRMGFGNEDPLPYQEMNNTTTTHNTYPTNETYTNEVNSIPQPPMSSTQMDFTGNAASNSTTAFSQSIQPVSAISNSYNTNPAPAFSTFSQPSQVSTAAAAFDGSIAPEIAPLTQNNPSNIYSVVATYIPTLSDELEIEMGDQIELIAEFDDGWCQGTNITKGCTTGVFPRHCIDRVPAPNNNAVDVERTKRVSSIRIQ